MTRAKDLGLLLALGALAAAPLAGQDLTTLQVSRQIGDEQSFRVEFEYHSGRARVVPSDSRTLYSMRLVYDAERVRPVHEYSSGRVVLGVSAIGGPASFFRRGFQGAEVEVALTNRIPLTLDLEMGAVESNVDLGGLRLRGLTIETGAADGRLVVSAPNPEEMALVEMRVGAASFRTERLGNLNARTIRLEAGVGSVELDLADLRRTDTSLFVKFGVGSVVIRIPRDAGIRLRKSVFLTSVDAPGLEGSGEVLTTPGYERAERRVEIQIEAGLGSVEIVRSDP